MVNQIQQKTVLSEILETELQQLLNSLGEGRTDGVAYDTAWVARLKQLYSHPSIAASLDWLRQHQYQDGTWGASVLHYHDRYLSTLAALVSLKIVGQNSQDWQRIQQAEKSLWQLAGLLLRDDHDTIGFPILASRLTDEAKSLGLDVPEPPIRYATAYFKKVDAFLNQTKRNWRESPISFSLEVLRNYVSEDDVLLDENASIAVSPSATAGYLLKFENEAVFNYLLNSLAHEGTGAARAIDSIDDFEVIWALNHLRFADLISPDNVNVKRVLDKLWNTYTRKNGLGYASYSLLTDADDTSSGWAVLQWGGYSVTADIFAIYETDEHFLGFLSETDPALSAQLRLLIALKTLDDTDSRKKIWIDKILRAIHQFDKNGIFWTDKWHASPYYANSTAVWALHGLDDTLAHSRVKWILRTQHDDGGWGHFGKSSPEESAYAMQALLWWDRHVQRIEESILNQAAAFLSPHLQDDYYTPLWIGKSLYSPHYVVKAAIISAMVCYLNR